MLASTIIIPSHNKAEQLAHTLRALVKQNCERERFEVIVVDDGSTDETHDIVDSFDDQLNLSYLFLPLTRSAAKSRNAGIALARSPLIILLDADVIPTADFVAAHLAAHDACTDAVILGRVFATEMTPETWALWVEDKSGDFANLPALEQLALSNPRLRDVRESVFADGASCSSTVLAPWAYCWTGNLSFKCALSDRAGLFDEAMLGKGSEDLEFGYRLHQAGGDFRFSSLAWGFHQPHPRRRQAESAFDRGQANYFLSKFPTLEVEALLAFDSVNMNPLLTHLEAFAACPPPTSAVQAELSLADYGQCLPGTSNLLLGADTGQLLRTNCFDCAAEVHRGALETLRRNYHDIVSYRLLGIALPFRDQTFDTVVITDIWRYFPESLTARMFQEALRVGRRLLILKHCDLSVVSLTKLDPVLQAHDRPYWEREHIIHVSRTIHDFSFQELSSQVGSPNVRLFAVQHNQK